MDDDAPYRLGRLTWEPAIERPDLLAPAVTAALAAWTTVEPAAGREVRVAAIDPEQADTAAMTAAYHLALEDSVNCVLVAGRREGVERVAALAVRATTRADVNGAVRRLLDVRKASFWPDFRSWWASDRVVSAVDQRGRCQRGEGACIYGGSPPGFGGVRR